MSTLSYDATGAARQAHEQHLPALLEDRIASRIFAKDPTLWGPDAEAESAVRLGWVEAATVSQPLVGGILELRDALRAEGIPERGIDQAGGDRVDADRRKVQCQSPGHSINGSDSGGRQKVRLSELNG